MEIRAIIVDDEVKLAGVLKMKLERYVEDIEIVGVCHNVEDAYSAIKSTQPNLVFLDISMPGDSGFDLLSLFQNPEFEVVFVTGHSEYMLEALRASAVDYLLKPLKTEDLIQAVQKARLRISQKENVWSNNTQNRDLIEKNVIDKKIAIPDGNIYKIVPIQKIIRCEGIQKYTKIFLTDSEPILSSYNIGLYATQLSAYSFYECHKSHIVNIQHIDQYHKEGTIVMIDGSRVPVSRRKKKEFVETVLKKTFK